MIRSFLVKHPRLYDVLYYFYSLIVDFNGREHEYKNAVKKENIVYYVIRPRTNCIEGLLSLFIFIMKKYEYAIRKNYMPIIDLKNYVTQYSNGRDNVWEWFFTQPNNLTLDEVYASENKVILSGYKWNSTEDADLFSNKIFYDKSLNAICNHLILDNFCYSSEIEQLLDKEIKDLLIEQCIGVYLRGTDYVKLKPAGESIQPTVDMVIDKIWEFSKKYNNPPIFLVTEDRTIYEKIKSVFSSKLRLVSFDSFIDNYDGKDFLSKSNVFTKDMKTVGMEYLTKMILLSKCKYLISSITCGSRVSYVLNGNKYEDKYIFDLGLYQ